MVAQDCQYTCNPAGWVIFQYAFQDLVLQVWNAEECLIFFIQNIHQPTLQLYKLIFLTSWHATTLLTFYRICILMTSHQELSDDKTPRKSDDLSPAQIGNQTEG